MLCNVTITLPNHSINKMICYVGQGNIVISDYANQNTQPKKTHGYCSNATVKATQANVDLINQMKH